jgi:hypothetical protein
MFALPPIQPDPPAPRPVQAAPVAAPGATQALSGDPAGEGVDAGPREGSEALPGPSAGARPAAPAAHVSGPAAELSASLRALLSALRSASAQAPQSGQAGGALAAAAGGASAPGGAPAAAALGAGALAQALASAGSGTLAGLSAAAGAGAQGLSVAPGGPGEPGPAGARAAGLGPAAEAAPAGPPGAASEAAESPAPAFGGRPGLASLAALLGPEAARAALLPYARALFLGSAPRNRGPALLLAEWLGRAQAAPGALAGSPWRALLEALARPPELAEPAFGAWRRLLRRLAQDEPASAQAEQDQAAPPPELAESLAAERLTQSTRALGGQAWALAWPWFDGQALRELWVHAEPAPEGGSSQAVQRASVGLELPRLGAVRADFWLHGAGLSVRLCFESAGALEAARAQGADLLVRLGAAGRAVRLELAQDGEAARAAARGQLGGDGEPGPGWRA